MGLQFLWWDDPRCPRRRSLPSMFPMQQAPLCPERKSFIIFVCRFHQSIIAYLKHFSQPQRTIRIGRGRFSVVISADCVSVDLGRERIIMTDRRRFSLAHSASRSVFGNSDHGPITVDTYRNQNYFLVNSVHAFYYCSPPCYFVPISFSQWNWKNVIK